VTDRDSASSERDSVSSLSKSASLLREEVRGLRDALTHFGPRVRRAEFLAFLGVTLVLFGLVAFGLLRQNDTNRRIDGLCPVFALVIGSADPDSRPAGPARELYEESIRVITQAYGQLACTDPIVPPRSPTPTYSPQPG
jgi:hypothetical protein